MSGQAISAAMHHHLPSPAWKAVLLVIAHHCDERGEGCFAFQTTIAAEADTNERTVGIAVKAMLAAGVLKRTVKGGRQVLAVEMDCAIEVPRTRTTIDGDGNAHLFEEHRWLDREEVAGHEVHIPQCSCGWQSVALQHTIEGARARWENHIERERWKAFERLARDHDTL